MNKMISKFLLFGAVFMVSVACSTETTQEVEDIVVSTEENKAPPKNDLGIFLKGEWLEIGENCNKKGGSCATPTEPSSWFFGDGDVKWNGFTHTYIEKEDTLFISGSPYCVVGELTDTILLHAVITNRFTKLVRQ